MLFFFHHTPYDYLPEKCGERLDSSAQKTHTLYHLLLIESMASFVLL